MQDSESKAIIQSKEEVFPRRGIQRNTNQEEIYNGLRVIE